MAADEQVRALVFWWPLTLRLKGHMCTHTRKHTRTCLVALAVCSVCFSLLICPPLSLFLSTIMSSPVPVSLYQYVLSCSCFSLLIWPPSLFSFPLLYVPLNLIHISTLYSLSRILYPSNIYSLIHIRKYLSIIYCACSAVFFFLYISMVTRRTYYVSHT